MLIVAIGVAAVAVGLYLRETVDFDQSKAALVQSLTDERDQLEAVRQEIETRIGALQADIANQEERVQRAAKVIATLRELENWWDRLIGNPEQQKANAEQIKRMEDLKTTASAQLIELRRALVQTTWEREGLEIALNRAQQRLQAELQTESRAVHYARRAWDEAKVYVLTALAIFLFGPTLMKLVLFYGLAPLLAKSRPIRLAEASVAQPAVGDSRVSVDTALWPGECLYVKEPFLQASDEGLEKKTRFLLDWRIPFTSIACGLSELVAMRNVLAQGERRVTFSNADDPHMELSIISVPEGGSLILRPSFLAGVITHADKPLRIRPRWQLFRWQAWISLQFRYFEFHGPCRLLVVGSRGVRAERLVKREGRQAPARRTNQRATIGFTPSLDYRPVRAETFWGYYRGMNPLFDDLFAGQGVFLVQETSTDGSGVTPGNFWASVWGGVLKVMGI
ncbi:hypothetical protein MASR2M8_25790 [Opitutaceae bacterium]